ncbi:hypothetical protein BDAP_000101 [Binucleata daphniae]
MVNDIVKYFMVFVLEYIINVNNTAQGNQVEHFLIVNGLIVVIFNSDNMNNASETKSDCKPR